jgi:3-oxoadipate enol-lactonase
MATFLTADGTELHYTDLGPRGTLALLFLHGWYAASTIWTPVVSRLAKLHRTIAVDMRGFGESNAAAGPYNVEIFSDDLSALIAAANLDPLVVIGHSMGAAIAQRFAIDRPEAVEGLVLIAPVPAGGLDFPAKVDAMFHGLPGNPQATNAWLSRLMSPEPPAAVRALVRSAAAAVRPEVALESYKSWSTLNFAGEAATIDTPTLVIASDGDRPEVARARVAELIVGSRFEILRDAAHYAVLEQPDRIAGLIEGFIADL